MVRSQLGKSTFREIKSSLGRFMAILAIIGLGVGFFAGLKIAKQAMVATVEDYLAAHRFYDYRILSTLGFEEESVKYLKAREGVVSAEGGLSFDVIYGVRKAEFSVPHDGEEFAGQGVVKTYSLPEELNTVQLVFGRMPLQDDECVADSNLFGEGDLGSVLVFTEENDEETLDHFTFDEYTVVGLVQSPLYLQYERGNTSLGDGRLDGFVYLTRDGFADSYYTEIYVELEGDHELYGDGYQALMDASEEIWEAYGEEASEIRYQSILADAESELADARKELADKRAEGEEELADAAATLADAERELRDGEEALADARQELEDGKRTLEEKQAELADAIQTVAEKEAELADARQTFAEKEAELADGEKKYQDGLDEYSRGSSSLGSAKNTLKEKKKELAEQKALLEKAAEPVRQLESGIADVKKGLRQLQDGIADAENGIQKIDFELGKLQEHIEQLQSQAPPPEDLEEQLAAMHAEMGVYESKKEELERGIEDAKNRQMPELQAQLAELQMMLEYAKSTEEWSELEAALRTIAQAQAQIAGAEAEIENADRQLASGWTELENARMEIEDGRRALEDGRAEIADGEQALADARVEITDGEKALADARRELADAETTLAEKEAELADAQAEYEDGVQEYLDAQAEFDEKIADAESELADAEQELADLEPPETYLLGRDTNVGYVCFENDSGIVEGIANIFPVFFILVAALVCITTMNRMVEEQRTQIGMLKALGYSEAAVMSKYVIYSGLAAVIGCVAGFLLGTWGFPKVIWAAYGIMYRAEDILYVFDWRLAVFSVAVSLLCSVGTTWLSCRVELSQVAAQLMRPKAPKAGKRVFLERIPLLWNRLSFLRKVSLRNIFRYKKRLFMMILGISGCTALLVTGFGIKDSIAGIADRQFEEIQTFDLGLSLKDPADDRFEDELNDLEEDGVSSFLCVMEKNMDLVTESGIKSAILIVGDPLRMPGFVNLHTPEEVGIPYPGKDECVISDKLAADYGVEAGDVITLRDENMREIKLTVTAIQKNYIYNYVHISEATWEDQMGEDVERKTVYVNVKPEADVHGTAAALMQLTNVSNVTVNLDTMERIGSMMASLDIIVVTVILCAAGLAFIVLYNLTNINITERIREIATIKVLGFYKKETASYVFRENLLLSAMGMALGLVLGKLLHSFVMHEIQIDMIAFDVFVKPVSYVYSGLLTMGFAWLVGKVMGGKLESISMTESLKSVD